ncbi:sarcosine oxidase subunit gamma family protein [Xinfangfangia sp. CPCC 101601]|uniref:Sarcosine oxidase subunit gamma family protein n=1 Tax=Pseudogemmobacter lacusdianii TaxID=3069608 RepID=A0ABU0W195_9RHOB|nr:sarcosine oxidase subunit gamma family protein [Xinfangfangia sp. CPCC 101601]MDQ2067790.1 sarcosine oxidase subunit gamma family protein [Xinfangfangia sp. CPCC 101601]
MSILAKSAFGNLHGSSHALASVHRHDIHDRADLAAVLVVATDDDAAAELASIGLTVPTGAGPMVAQDGLQAIWLSPRSWVIQCAPEAEMALVARINAAFDDRRITASLFGDHLAWIEISGADPQALLRRGGFVSLDAGGIAPGSAKRTLVAEVNVILCHIEPGRLLAGVERSRARYFVDWLKQAAKEPSPAF